MNPIETLNTLIGSVAWPTLRGVLHVTFFLVVLYLLKVMLWDQRGATGLRHLPKAKRIVGPAIAALVVLFGAALAYQASWQLAGVTRPRFIAFMQTYDRRQFNPAHGIERGRILDSQGEVLAFSALRDGRSKRVYPYGPAFAHVVGYTDARYGAAGMEAAANAHLNGSTPVDLKAWGQLGRQVLTRDRHPKGQDLVLTLDTELQLMAARALGERRGAVVMLRPGDGAIRVLLSTPGYDPNAVTGALFQGRDPAAPLLSRATQGLYPPGSTFKVVVAAEALNAGFRGTLPCPADGFTTSARYPKIRDHEYYSARRRGQTWRGHGSLDLSKALAESSNVFFAQLGDRLGHDAFHDTLDRFQFNRELPLHEGLFGAQTMQTGRIRRIARSDRYGLAQAAIGQGRMLTTPAQMALVAATVANGGLMVRPRLVVSDQPKALGRPLGAADAARLGRMMRRVVSEGTGRGIDTEGLAIAGKTGTAQNPGGKSHSWFIGYAPAGSRERHAGLAVAVLVEEGGYGSATAAPIARDLLVQAHSRGMLR
jgi:peptidoglycan glycosyltransferase